MTTQFTWADNRHPEFHGGGLVLTTSGANGTCTCWNELDQDGQISNDDGISGKWHQRVVKLDRLAGSQVSMVNFNGDQNSTGSWTINFADIALVSADGLVTTIYNGETYGQNAGQNLGPNGLTTPLEGDSGDTITENLVVSTPVTGTPTSVSYYLDDEVGTTQMELSMDGWPLWQGQFAPSGQQLDTNLTSMRFKFTGKERDEESGLDYFGARYYGSSMGRWMSPDWASKPEAVPYSSLDDPQSLNLYGYVRNNPLSRVDPDGHEDCCTISTPTMEEVDAVARPLIASATGALVTGAEITVSTAFAPIVAIGGMLFSPASAGSAHEDQVLRNEAAQRQSEHSEAAPEPQTSTGGAGARQGGNGTIYRVLGSGSKSGKPYIGRHNKPDPAKTRKSKDGRDRSQAEVVDTYNASDTAQGRQKEQQQIDSNGGVSNLDNKRNEIKPTPQ